MLVVVYAPRGVELWDAASEPRNAASKAETASKFFKLAGEGSVTAFSFVERSGCARAPLQVQISYEDFHGRAWKRILREDMSKLNQNKSRRRGTVPRTSCGNRPEQTRIRRDPTAWVSLTISRL